MLVFYHRMGLEVTPGKQVTYAIIIAYIVFKTVRQSSSILISITFYGGKIYTTQIHVY